MADGGLASPGWRSQHNPHSRRQQPLSPLFTIFPSYQASIRVFLVLSSATPRNNTRSPKDSSTCRPAGRVPPRPDRSDSIRRRGWPQQRAYKGCYLAEAFWQQGRTPTPLPSLSRFLLMAFNPDVTGGFSLIVTAVLLFPRFFLSKRIAAMHLPTSPAWFRDSSHFVWIYPTLFFVPSLWSWDIAFVSFVCHGLLSYGFTDLGFTA